MRLGRCLLVLGRGIDRLRSPNGLRWSTEMTVTDCRRLFRPVVVGAFDLPGYLIHLDGSVCKRKDTTTFLSHF